MEEELPKPTPVTDIGPKRRRPPWLGVAVIVVGGTVAFWIVFHPFPLQLRTPRTLRTCFKDAGGLPERSPVRLAGVEVGYVRTVRARPERRDCPAEVEMMVTAPYDLSIPRDSVAGVETAGVLGQPYIAIDVSRATGPPVENGGTLPSREEGPPLTIEKLVDLFKCGSRKAPAEETEDQPTASSRKSRAAKNSR